MIRWVGILSFLGPVMCHSAVKNLLNDETMFFDRSVPEYETVLTPQDFEMATQAADIAMHEIWDSDAMYGKTRFEGDIANPNLNASTVEMFMNGGMGGKGGSYYNAIKNRHQLWPNGKIPYTISSQYSSYSRSLIAASMQEYSKGTCISWVPKQNNDVNYIRIYPDRGCYSMVGKMGGQQSLSLGSGCIQKGIIIHELMHAVGFFHEQSRTDRDDFITIMWNNIQPGMQGQFEKYGQGTIQSLGTTYDYSSIMHYGSKAFSRNGQPTMVPKQRNAEIGQRGGFSKTDKYKINKLYGCPTDGGAKTTTTTAAPTTTTTVKTIATQKPIYPSPPTMAPTTTAPSGGCRNLRGDCDELAKQGWCSRNPSWMKQHCPIPCGFCTKPTQPTTTARPIKPNTGLPPPPPVNPGPPSDCEDLRVDCIQLVSQRYCKLSQTFMKTYCARSCGFCSRPPPTEVPNLPGRPVTKVVTSAPLVTFYPTTSRGTTKKPTGTTGPPTPHPCQDKKHFCGHWKAAGFCEGIFMSYMKKNCPAACGMC